MTQPPIQLQYARAALQPGWPRWRRGLMAVMTVPSAVVMFTPVAFEIRPFDVLRYFSTSSRNDLVFYQLTGPFLIGWLLLALQVRMLISWRVTVWERVGLALLAGGSLANSGHLMYGIKDGFFNPPSAVSIAYVAGIVLALGAVIWGIVLIFLRKPILAVLVSLVGAYSVNVVLVGIGFYSLANYGWWLMIASAALLLIEIVLYHLWPVTNSPGGGITHSR